MVIYTELSQPFIAGCAGCGHVFVARGASPTCPLCNRLADVNLPLTDPSLFSSPGSPAVASPPSAGDRLAEPEFAGPRGESIRVVGIFLRESDEAPDYLRTALAHIGLANERVGPTVSRLLAIRDDLYSLPAESTNPGTASAADPDPAEASADPQAPVDMDIACPHCQGAIRLKITEQDVVVEAVTAVDDQVTLADESPGSADPPPLATPEAAMQTAYGERNVPQDWDE